MTAAGEPEFAVKYRNGIGADIEFVNIYGRCPCMKSYSQEIPRGVFYCRVDLVENGRNILVRNGVPVSAVRCANGDTCFRKNSGGICQPRGIQRR